MILKKMKRLLIFFVFIEVILVPLIFIVLFGIVFDYGLSKIIFLDVGQGDGILIMTSNGQNILIDGGPNSSVLDGIGRNLPFYDKKIDMVVATHPDLDHIGGLVSVLERYDIGMVVDSGVLHDSEARDQMLEVISKKKIPVVYAISGQIFEFGDGEVLEILYPFDSFSGKTLEDNNDASIVAKFSDGEIDALLTGDAPIASEHEIISVFGDFIESEILKIGHHGSKNSSSKEFVEKVSPEVSIVSCGKENKYGHPDFKVLKILKDAGSYILRTDELGDIVLVSNGKTVELR